MATVGKDLSAYDKTTMPDASKMQFGIVVSEWNEEITNGLLNGALSVFNEMNVPQENVHIMHVPGSFELIFGSKLMQKRKELDAVIAIGSVIRGETAHFDFVCSGVTQGIADLNIQGDIPVVFCVLTDDNIQQSRDRSGGKHGNKGAEAAVVAIRMAHINKS